MLVRKIVEILEAELLTGESELDFDIPQACGSDLMSDVLAFAHGQGVLLTGLINPQVIRTAEMMDIKAIVFVRGKIPEADLITFAKEKELVLMRTRFPMFTACGKLYHNGLRGREECRDDG